MTNHWIDMINADVVLIMGGNPAEDHPIAMNWLRRVKERGAYILHVDPRFNRTSSIADVFAKLRSGTDIAFVGGMIHYAIEQNRIQQEYVREYTNASWIVGDGYNFDDGLFAGYDPKSRRYDRSQWAYALDAQGQPRRDPTLKHPRCVFQLLKRHFSRYDADAVCRITGTPKENYLRVCDLYTSTFAPDRAGTWLYAMGTAQHSHGTQNIRSYAILQLLLGNIGIAGGGVNAMRGESNVQGSTDQGLNYDGLPGYLRLPVQADADLKTYLSRVTPTSMDPSSSANWLQNTPKYVVSLLKAWWGERATGENEFAFSYLPKLGAGFEGQGYAFLALTHAMLAGDIKGLFCFGQNPAVGGANARLIRAGLDKLEWMVVADLFEHETAGFWKRPGTDPAKIPTEVFVLPAASGVEKEGSIVNSGRWAQWRYQAIKPIADCRPDLDIVDGLAKAIKRAYEKDGVIPGANPRSRVGLWGSRRSSSSCPRAERTLPGRRDRQRRQKLCCRQAGVGLRSIARRRHHDVRQLDLLRRLHRRGQPRRAPRYDRCAEWHWTLSKVVVGLADEPAHSLQPRLGQSQRRALQPAQMGDPLECREKNLGRRCA